MLFLLNRVALYSIDHAKTKAILFDPYKKLISVLDVSPTLVIGIADDKIIVEEEDPQLSDAITRKFVALLKERKIDSITFRKGISEEEWKNFIQSLLAKPEKIERSGGIDKLLRKLEIRNISANEVSFIKVPKGEDGTFVIKRELTQKRQLIEDAVIANFLLNKVDISQEKLMHEVELDPARFGEVINKLVKDSGFVSEKKPGHNPGIAKDSIEKIGNNILEMGISSGPEFRKYLVNIIIALDPEIRDYIAHNEYSITPDESGEDLLDSLIKKLSSKVKARTAIKKFKEKEIDLKSYISEVSADEKEKDAIWDIVKNQMPHTDVLNEETLPPAPSKKVLIVEDNDSMRILFRDTARKCNFLTLEAEDGLKALELIKTVKDIDLIILDIKLPKVHGLDILESLKKMEKKIPVIICTAFSSLKDDLSVVSYPKLIAMDKPVSIEELENNLKGMLSED